jgi:phage shock protein PspC (stress-responsive transcriptional regulator)
METSSSARRPRGPRGLRSPQAWHRDYDERRIAGVCLSLAHNLEISVTAVRLAFIVLALFHGVGIILYVALWALLPDRVGEPAALDRWIREARSLLGDGPRRSRRHDDAPLDYDDDYDDEPGAGR